MPFAITYYHLIWTTRDRAALITKAQIGTILDAIDEVAERHHSKLYALSVMPDHVHIALAISPRIAVADWVRDAKNASARAMVESFPDVANAFAWASGYGVVTFGSKDKDKVVRYVKRQPAVHADGPLMEALEKVGE